MQAEIFSQVNFDEAIVHTFDKIQLCLFTAQSPTKETVNEDSLGYILLDNDNLVVLVADGAGGHPKGEEASRIVIETVMAYITALDTNNVTLTSETIRNTVLTGMEAANSELLKLSIGARTTLTVTMFSHKKMRCFQVGDSGVVVSGQKGLLRYRSLAHSPVGYALAGGIISEADALHHPNLNEVSNLMGEPTIHIDLGPEVSLNDNDTAIICSDGVLDNYTSSELVEMIRKTDIVSVARSLFQSHMKEGVVDGPRDNWKYDDLTFALVRYL